MLNFQWFKKIFIPQASPAMGPSNHVPYRPLEAQPVFGPEIWAVGGGKGGVGKSFVASNLGLLLSKQGNRVLMVDADLGAANLHTFLGTDGGRLSISSFLKDEVTELRQVVTKTQYPNLDLISGAKDSLDVADVNGARLRKLRDALRKLDYEYILLDIGPGTSSNILDLYLMSREGILLTTPEPTTIENNYRFLKCLFLRKIKNLADAQEDGRLNGLLQKIFSEKWNQRVKTVSDIVEQLAILDQEQGAALKRHLADTRISLLMNQVKAGDDTNVGDSIKKACSDYFGMEIGYLGHVLYDNCVGESIRARKPLAIDFAGSQAARKLVECIGHIACRKTAGAEEKAFNIF